MRNINNVLSKFEKPKRSKGKLLLTGIVAASAFYFSLKEGDTSVEKINAPQIIYSQNEKAVSDTVYVERFEPINSFDLQDYKFIVTNDSSKHPFTFDNDIYDTVRVMTNGLSAEKRAKTLYDWVENFEYRNLDEEPIMNAKQVFDSGKGLCAELAYLYIASARIAGLKADYVNVDKDYKGEEVNHACAGVTLDNKLILVDPAYHQFDVKHQIYNKIDDNEATRLFQLWSK